MVDLDQPLDHAALQPGKDVLFARVALELVDYLIGIVDPAVAFRARDIFFDQQLRCRPRVGLGRVGRGKPRLSGDIGSQLEFEIDVDDDVKTLRPDIINDRLFPERIARQELADDRAIELREPDPLAYLWINIIDPLRSLRMQIVNCFLQELPENFGGGLGLIGKFRTEHNGGVMALADVGVGLLDAGRGF